MSIRIVGEVADARRGIDLLCRAQDKIAEAAALLGAEHLDGGLGGAIALLAAECDDAEALIATRTRRQRRGLRRATALRSWAQPSSIHRTAP